MIIVSAPVQRNVFFGFFRLGLDLGPVGKGDWDLDFGLTISHEPSSAKPDFRQISEERSKDTVCSICFGLNKNLITPIKFNFQT